MESSLPGVGLTTAVSEIPPAPGLRDMTAERKYSDSEVALILRRAIEMQQDPAVRGEGLRLQEVRDIAREIGVDPELVTAAANQLPAAGRGHLARFLGGTFTHDIRLVHEPALSPDQLQGLVMAIRSAMEHQGRTREVMGSLEWTTVGEVSQVAVTATPHEGGTTIHVIADRTGSAILTTVGSVGLGVFAAAITGAIFEPGVAGGVAVMGTGLAAGALLARTIWQRTTRGFQRKLARLNGAIRQRPEG
jgi:hypothetical protein